jgi:hypothetical protein
MINKIHGCIATTRLNEIDGAEFEIETLSDLVSVLQGARGHNIHLSFVDYIQNKETEDIDLWLKVSP